MKRFLGPLLVAVVLTGCGDDNDRADDPATGTPSETSQRADLEVVDIVSGSAAGGDVAETATVIEDEAALGRYVRQFDSGPFVGDLTDAIDAHKFADGRVLGLAVIEISCDEPPSAHVDEQDGAFVVTAGKVVAPHIECFAPVTSVAVLDLPE